MIIALFSGYAVFAPFAPDESFVDQAPQESFIDKVRKENPGKKFRTNEGSEDLKKTARYKIGDVLGKQINRFIEWTKAKPRAQETTPEEEGQKPRKSTKWNFDPRNLGKWFDKNKAIRMAKEKANGTFDDKQQSKRQTPFENLLRGLDTKQKEEVTQAFIKTLEANYSKEITRLQKESETTKSSDLLTIDQKNEKIDQIRRDIAEQTKKFNSEIKNFRKDVETTLKPNEIMTTLVGENNPNFHSYEIINLHEINFTKPLGEGEMNTLFDSNTLSTHTSNTGEKGTIKLPSTLMNILAKGIANKLKFNDQETFKNQLNRQIGIITDTPWIGMDPSFKKAILARFKTDIIKQDTQENNTDDAMPVQQELQAIEAEQKVIAQTAEPTVTPEKHIVQPTEKQKNNTPAQAKNPDQEDELDIARRIRNLTPEEVLKKLLTFNRTEIAYLTKEQLQDIPVDELMKLHDNQLDALVLNRLTTRQLIAILPKYQYQEAQLNRSYTKEQIQSIGLAEFETLVSKLDQGQITRLIVDLSDAQLAIILPTLTPRQIRFMTSQQIESLTADQFNNLSLEQVHQFQVEQLKVFTIEQINNFNLDQFSQKQLDSLLSYHESLATAEKTPEEEIITEKLRTFIDNREEKMTEAIQQSIKQLTIPQIKELDQQIIQKLTPTELEAFNKDQIQNFSDDQLNYLSENQIPYIPIEYFTDQQIHKIFFKLSGLQISKLSKEQIQNIAIDDLETASTNNRKLAAIDSSKFSLNQVKDLFSMLSPDQIHKLPKDIVQEIPLETLKKFPRQRDSINAQNLTEEQVQLLLPTKINDPGKLTRQQVITLLSNNDYEQKINYEQARNLVEQLNIGSKSIEKNTKLLAQLKASYSAN